MLYRIRSKINAWRLNLQSYRRKRQLGKSIDPASIRHLTPTIAVDHKWYGSSYGGFYIIPSLLSSDSIIYSFGIGKDVSFDLACINRHGCHLFAFDPTPVSIDWIHRERLPHQFHFHSYGIGKDTGETVFYLPENPKGISGSIVGHEQVDRQRNIVVLLKSLADVTAELKHKHIDVLKMDIEGAEYEVMDSIISAPISIDQILIEFHDRFINQEAPASLRVVEKLKSAGYHIFGSSISYEEISFVHERKLGRL